MKMSLARLIMILSATIALVFTFIGGIMSHIPWFNILQRTIVSFISFSILGYFLGNWIEQHLQSLSPEETVGLNFDANSKQTEQAEQEPENFEPFTANSFEHLETK